MAALLVVAAGALPAAAVPLAKAVEDALDVPTLDGATVGLVVWDAAGVERLAIDPDRRLLPASTAKWVTAAAAAHTLGLDFAFATTVAATGYTEGGTLHGDLVVVGAGDPSTGDPDPGRFVRDVVAIARACGIEAVDGDVVVDASRFAGPTHGPGWMWDDFAYAYSPPYAAANIGHNLLVGGLGCEAYGGPGSPLVDPPGCLATALVDQLRADGVGVTGAAAARPAPDAVPIGAVTSAPLRTLLRKMLVDSDNLYAECIGRSVCRAVPAAPADASARIARVLQDAGITPDELRLVDASGLSRYSFGTARSFVALSAWIEAQAWGGELVGLLPVAGREGTLSGRMVGTPAEGRVHAKTGSMTGVRNLVGYADGPSGRLRFAFLINGLAAPQAEVIAVQDRVVALIAASDGRRVPRDRVRALEAPGERPAAARRRE